MVNAPRADLKATASNAMDVVLGLLVDPYDDELLFSEKANLARARNDFLQSRCRVWLQRSLVKVSTISTDVGSRPATGCRVCCAVDIADMHRGTDADLMRGVVAP